MVNKNENHNNNNNNGNNNDNNNNSNNKCTVKYRTWIMVNDSLSYLCMFILVVVYIHSNSLCVTYVYKMNN